MLTAGYVEPVPAMVSLWTDGWSVMSVGVSGGPGSAAWESDTRGVWFPLYVPATCVAKRMWWANGSTVSASYNVEAGIYLDAGYKPGAKLITTGSVAQGTATAIKFAHITDTTLTPGNLWLYMSCSSSSATFFRQAANAVSDELFKFQQASIGPGSAPTTATPAEASSANVYLFGFSTTTIT